ncbi:MAG: hypothetical protein BGO89_11735 [Candidatus Kapaibacterium thiocyanatum]|uniref:Uncharacterized protein n=1 Tax=Candidatus Kapaibacterium thiocyanatum TaxID=1895771 RepID=A0A1M3KXJ0_9BACT|nr:MAG: hypothetical protein BGO89_11735 ['Candidatus Kapabacteria' thiocyanatum]
MQDRADDVFGQALTHPTVSKKTYSGLRTIRSYSGKGSETNTGDRWGRSPVEIFVTADDYQQQLIG